MDSRGVQPKREWPLMATMLVIGVVLLRESVHAPWAQGSLFVWVLILLALLYFRPSAD